MSKATQALGLGLAVACAAGVHAGTPDETAGVRRAVQAYFDGAGNSDADSMRRAFHPEMRMLFMRDGALQITTLPEWLARLSSASQPAGPKPQRRILAVDIEGDAASVKAEVDAPDYRLVDYLSLLKIDGQWRIVGKIFSRLPKPKVQP